MTGDGTGKEHVGEQGTVIRIVNPFTVSIKDFEASGGVVTVFKNVGSAITDFQSLEKPMRGQSYNLMFLMC